MYDNALELYNGYQDIYFDEYKTLQNVKKENWVINLILLSYFLKHITMPSLKMKNRLIQQQKSDIPSMAPLEQDDEVKEGKGLKFLTPNKLLTRLPIILVQKKLEIIQKNKKSYIFYIRIVKSPKTFTTISSSHYNNGNEQ